jgi:hypothetical protein
MKVLAKILIVVGIIGMLTVVAFGSSYPPPPNVRITNYPQLNNEEQVFICPTDSNIIIANWRDFRLNYRQIGIGRSTDGGLTWTDSLIFKPDMQIFGYDSKQSDPTMTVDRFGNFYMSVLDYDGFGLTGLSTISFYRSDDKGISWTGPVPGMWTGIPDVFEDKQFITVDRTGGTYDGNLYCSWTRFPNPDRIVFVRSVDGGDSFEDTVVVGPIQNAPGCSNVDAGQFSIPVVTSNGDVHVLWQGWSLDSADECTGLPALKHVVSTDGGVTFTTENIISQASLYTTADGGINTYSQPAADADITGGPFDGNLYVSFTNMAAEDASGNTDVDFIMSSDNGETWTSRYQINDATDSDEIDSFHPWLIVNEEGVIIVIFYDQRFDPGHFLFDVLAAYSFDGGETFTTNHRISDVSSSPSDLKHDPEEKPYIESPDGMHLPIAMGKRAGLLGEYICVTAYHDKINAVWTDSRDGNSEAYAANWYLPLLETRLQSPVSGAYVSEMPEFRWSTAWKHDQDSYRLEIAPDESFEGDFTTHILDTNVYTLDFALEEAVYFWRVKSLKLDGSDSSDYSRIRSFEVDSAPPAEPQPVAPTDGLTTNSPTPEFQWAVSVKGSPETFTLWVSTDAGFPVGSETKSYAGLEGLSFTPPDPLTESVLYYWKVEAVDAVGNSTSSVLSTLTYIDYVCGDADNNLQDLNIADLVYLVMYMFQDGPAPYIMESVDVDSSGGNPDITDLIWIVKYMFQDGPDLNCP